MRGDSESEFITGEQHTGAFFLAQNEMSLELGERRDAVLELPFPVVPLFRRHIAPIARRMRDELFPVPLPCCRNTHFVCRKTLKATARLSMQAPLSASRTP